MQGRGDMHIITEARKPRIQKDFTEHLGLIADVETLSGVSIRGRVEAVHADTVDLKGRNSSTKRIPYEAIKAASFEAASEASGSTAQSSVGQSVPAGERRRPGRNSLYRKTVKTTLQLPESAIDQLDEIVPELRRHVPRQKRSLVTKGAVIDILTRFGLEEIRSNGAESLAVRLTRAKLDER